jgi:hypothetical protein
MPAPRFAPGGSISMPRGFASQPVGYPQGQNFYQSFPQEFQYPTTPDTYYTGRSVQPIRYDGARDGASFKPREPLPGPWLAKSQVPKAAPRSQKTSFWSTEDNVLKRELAAQHLCHVKEELLEQRITFVENVLFRAMDLPAHDVRYAAELTAAEQELEEKKKAEDKDKHDHDFERHYIGPYPEVKVTEKCPENGFFVDSLRAVRDWPYHEEKARENERWRHIHPFWCALYGDWHYVHKELKEMDLI